MFKKFYSIFFITIMISFSPILAESVKLKYKGLILNGELRTGKDKKLSDGVILMVHGTMAHNGMEIISTIQKALTAKGLNTLAITLSLAENDRQGMYDCKSLHRHKHADSVDEIGAWASWLQEKGAGKIVLWGHSRGGNQVALYATEKDSELLKAVILVAPGIFDDDMEERYNKRYGNLSKTLGKAESLVEAKKGDTILENIGFLFCGRAKATAESFASYFSKKYIKPTTSLLPKIKKPVLVFTATEDITSPDTEIKIKPLADGKKIRLKSIYGADHFFRDLFADEVADGIEEFLNGN